MRQSAVWTFERVGVALSVAGSIVGNRTESIHSRYAIVGEGMQHESAVRLNAFILAMPVGKTAGALEIFVAEAAKNPSRNRTRQSSGALRTVHS